MNLLGNLAWRDFLDVAVVAVFVYYLLLMIQGTRAVQIIQGLVVLLLLQALFYQVKLQTAYYLLRALVVSIVVALPILFQPELRRALMRLGARSSIVSPFSHVSRDILVKIVDEIAWAASILAQTKTGALIAIERETGLEEYIESGVKVNGEISSKLLLSIFKSGGSLHDGATILRGDKVVAAGCYLPLSETPLTARDRTYGTRHRSAIGLSEQTDAIVVVVSEEAGTISIARDGKLTAKIDEETLKKELVMACSPPPRTAPPTMVRAPARSLLQWIQRTASRLVPTPTPVPVVAGDPLPLERHDEPDRTTHELYASEVALSRDGFREAASREPAAEATAEAQRLTEEVVQKRAEEAQRRKAEEEEERRVP